MATNATVMYLFALFFILIGVLVPYMNDDFGHAIPEYDTDSLIDELDQSDQTSGVSFWEVIGSVISMFFWSFGILPAWVDAIIFLPLRITFWYLVIKG